MRVYNKHALRDDASEIARLVVLHGETAGWGGDLPELAEIQRILAPFGIVYVDDLRGAWAPARRPT